MNPGIENKPFEIYLNRWIDGDILSYSEESKIEVISQPKRLWFKEFLYYLSFGLYDRRGYIYKVKIIK